MEIRILGSLEARVDGRVVAVPAGQPRAVLILLALRAGEPVSADAIVDGLWEDGRAPASAHKMVQLYVSQLRRLGLPISTHGHGYALDAGPDDVDALRFERLVRAGDGAGALELWRGPPLADVPEVPFKEEARRRLEDLHLQARELVIDAGLERGEHRALVGELDALVAAHPLRERFRAQRMLALYRSGRQADALEAFREARAVLVEEVGIEPGPELHDLHERILRQDPELVGPTVWPGAGAPLRRRLTVIAVLVAVAAAALALGLSRGVGEDSLSRIDGDAVGLVDPEEERIMAQYPVGRQPSAAAAGRGAVWVASAQDGTVSRIDRARNLAVTVDVGGEPTALAFGGGALWVADAATRSLLQVDPESNRVTGRYPVGNTPRAVAVGFGAVWVASSIDDRVDRIDLASGRVERHAVGGGPAALAIGSDAVWVAAEVSGRAVRLDPRTGAVLASVPAGGGSAAIVADASRLWVLNRADATLTRIDPTTDAVDATVELAGRPTALALAENHVWVGDSDGRLVAIGKDTVTVDRGIDIGGAPAALVYVDGALWTATARPLAERRGGTLRYRVPAFEFCRCLDPAGYDGNNWPLLGAVYDGLTAYRRAGGASGTVLVPSLAERLPEPAANGRRYVFRLREGLRYSDGSPVRASDVTSSLERSFRLEPLAAESLYGGIVGAGGCTPKACDLSRGVIADDAARTVAIRLRSPDLEFLHKLAIPNAYVVPARSPVRLARREPLLGTGPYRVSRLDIARGGLLERNPRFASWSRDARPDGLPDAIEWTVSRNGREDVAAVRANEADVVGVAGITAVELPDRDVRALSLSDPARLDGIAGATSEFFFLNTRRPPFDDVRVRRALNFALDRRRLVELAGGEQLATPTCQIIPPGLPGYEPYCPYTAGGDRGGAWAAPDMVRARRLVARSSTRGTAITFHTFRGPFDGMAEHAARVMERLGYPSRVHRVRTADAHFRYILDSSNHAQAGVNGWIADYLTPSTFFESIFTCASVDRLPTSNNASRFCEPAVDAAFRRAVRRGGDAWAAADRLVVEAAAAAPTVNRRTVVLTSDRVGALEQSPIYGPLLDQTWVR